MKAFCSRALEAVLGFLSDAAGVGTFCSYLHSSSVPFRIRSDHLAPTETSLAKAMTATPYEKAYLRLLIFYILCIVTLGLFPLVLSWFPFTLHKIKYRKSSDVLSAHRFLITATDGQKAVVLSRKICLSVEEYRRALPMVCNNPLRKKNECVFLDRREQLIHHGASQHEFRNIVTTVVFQHQCLPFIYNIWSKEFEPLTFDLSVGTNSIHSAYGPGVFDAKELRERRLLHGPTCVNIPIQPLHKMIVVEVFHPFYVFQISAIGLWIWDGYYQYGIAIIITTVLSLFTEIYQMRRSQYKLQRMMLLVCDVRVLRQKGPLLDQNRIDTASAPCFETVPSTHLVPGDVVEIKPDMALPCDMLLLQGFVLVNESMLTGESVPVSKSSLPYVPDAASSLALFDLDHNRGHTLYGGTNVVSTRSARNGCSEIFGVTDAVPLALVVRTGFSTMQGRMMRSILHPPPSDRADFKIETYKFLAVLAVLATIGAAASLYMTFQKGLHPKVALIRALDTFPNAIPPSLTAAMTVGCSMAVTKLRNFWGILCIAPSRINVAGQVNTFVFDKTGTLTEDSLALDGVVCSAIVHHDYGSLLADVSTRTQQSVRKYDIPSADAMSLAQLITTREDVPTLFRIAMATCHSVMMANGDFSGEPMEIQMLRFSGARILDQSSFSINKDQPFFSPEHHSNVTGILDRNLPSLAEISVPLNNTGLVVTCIVKRFEFVAALQRMSVVVWDRSSMKLFVFCKGSPEELYKRCLPETVNRDFHQRLQQHTETGRRVLAFAYKRIPLKGPWSAVATCAASASSACSIAVESYLREDAETDLLFAGFCVFNNMLKADSCASIKKLLTAGCRCLVATGDNALTAAAVARATGIVNPVQNTILLGDILVQSKKETMDSPRTYTPSDDSKETGKDPGILVWTPIEYASSNVLSEVVHVNCNESLRDNSSAVHDLDPRPQEDCSLSQHFFLSSESLAAKRQRSVITQVESSLDVTHDARRSIQQDKHYSCQEVQDYLSGQDPRTITLVVTGAAFRYLMEQHQRLHLPWCSRLEITFQGAVDTLGGCPRSDAERFSFADTPMAGLFPLPRCAGAADIDDGLMFYPVMSATASTTSGSKVIDDNGGIFNSNHYDNSSGVASRRFSAVNSGHSITVLEHNRQAGDTEAVCTFKKKITSVRGARQKYAMVCIAVHHRDSRPLASLRSSLGAAHVFSHGDSDYSMLSEKEAQQQSLLSCSAKREKDVGSHSTTYISMSFFELCLRYCRVYARMSPDDKLALVTGLRSLPGSPVIGMCGDGANDTAALRAADIGLSFSDGEASIAAPFTSIRKNVTSAVDLLREARGALVNSFQGFKYIALYALLQLTTTLTLYSFGSNLTDSQYIWIDLVTVLPLSITMAWTHAASTLSYRLPLRRLVSFPVILSLMGQILIQTSFVGFSIALVKNSHFYTPFVPDSEREHFDSEALSGYENTVIFLVSNFQYIILSVVLSVSHPWRKGIATNGVFMAVLLALLTVSTILLLAPDWIPVVVVWLALVPLEQAFRYTLAQLVVANALVTVVFERGMVAGWATKREEARNDFMRHIDLAFPAASCVHFSPPPGDPDTLKESC